MNCVFITAIKTPTNEVRSEGYSYSVESWKRWCRANKVELRVLEQPLFDGMKPNFFRYWCFDLLEDEFDQICLVDADTVIHPDCPNFFNLTRGRFSAVHNDGDYDWIIRSIENYQHEFPNTFGFKFNIWKYFNSGFLIINKGSHEPLFKDFQDFVLLNYENGTLPAIQSKYGVGTDQPLINLFVQKYGGADGWLELLPYAFNMQDLARKNILDDRMLFTNIPGIYHFNAVPAGPGEVNKWMKKTYQFLHHENHI